MQITHETLRHVPYKIGHVCDAFPYVRKSRRRVPAQFGKVFLFTLLYVFYVFLTAQV